MTRIIGLAAMLGLAALFSGCATTPVVVPLSPAFVSFSNATWALTGCSSGAWVSATVGSDMISMFGGYTDQSLYTQANASKIAAAIVASNCAHEGPA